MNFQELNLTNFVKENRIERLSESNNIKFLEIARDEFDEYEQDLFFFFHEVFRNYDESNDFIVDFDIAWKICEYSRKDSAKRTLVNDLVENVDYKIFKYGESNSGNTTLLHSNVEQDLDIPNKHGGHNKEKIMLTTEGFKQFCIFAKTEQGRNARTFYIKLQRIVNIYLRNQTQENLKALEDAKAADLSKDLSVESNLVKSHTKKPLVYLGMVGDNLVKFGYTNGDIESRVRRHKSTFDSFVLKNVVLTEYCEELEREIKTKLKDHIDPHKVSETFTCTEIVRLSDDLTFDSLFERVLQMRDEIEDTKLKMPEKVIHLTYKELKKLKSFKRAALKGWGMSKRVVEEHCDNFEEIRLLFEGEVSNSEKHKLMIKFAERLYEEYAETQEWFSNKELYNLYSDYVSDKQSEAYCYSYKKFCDEFTITFKNTYKILRRVTVKRGEPGYDKDKNQTALGKEIHFDGKFAVILLESQVCRNVV